MPRAKTPEEVRGELLAHIKTISRYWAGLPNKTPRERCDGVAFSILVLLDGMANFPAVDLALQPHQDDQAFYVEQGENWYEPGMVINDCQLHDEFVHPDSPTVGGADE